MKVKELRNALEQLKGKKKQVMENIADFESQIIALQKELKSAEKAREIIKIVGITTQQNLQYHISDITSLALESIFPEPYKLVLEFVERRNKSECDILFERNGSYLKPINASGGGTVDVAAFALRIAFWMMARPRTQNVIILDEPMRFLSDEYIEPASMMIKEVSKKLGIQFIIITHEPVLSTYADKVFKVNISNGISKVK